MAWRYTLDPELFKAELLAEKQRVEDDWDTALRSKVMGSQERAKVAIDNKRSFGVFVKRLKALYKNKTFANLPRVLAFKFWKTKKLRVLEEGRFRAIFFVDSENMIARGLLVSRHPHSGEKQWETLLAKSEKHLKNAEADPPPNPQAP